MMIYAPTSMIVTFSSIVSSITDVHPWSVAAITAGPRACGFTVTNTEKSALQVSKSVKQFPGKNLPTCIPFPR